MSRKLFLMLVSMTTLLTPIVSGQDVCNALLKHGIYDHLVEIGATSSRSSAVNDICRAYYQEESDSLSGKAGGSYGLISGSASFSSAQIKRLGDQMCSHNAADAANSDYTKIDQNLISPSAVNAWQECTRNTLLATQTDWNDTDQGTTGVALSFHLAAGGASTVSSVTTTNIDCTSRDLQTIINNSQNTQRLPLTTTAYSLDCKRTVANAPFQSGMRQVYAESARVVVATSAGNITRDMPAILPPPTPNPIPPGTIVAWYATGANATVPPGWRLCDGTGGTPDLRDHFIRGTGDYTKVGVTGGSNDIKIPAVDLKFGLPDYGKSMRAEGGTGITNHSSAGNLVNSVTTPATVTTDGPPYISMMYIIKQ